MTIEFFNCNHALITSDLFTDYLNSEIYKLEMTIKINCCGSDFTVELNSNDLISGSYTLEPSYFGFEEFLPNGVYQVSLQGFYGTESNTTSVQGDLACKFHNCDLKCQVIEHLGENKDSEAHLYLYLLDHMDACPCQCDNMCEVYNLLLNELDTSSNTNTQTPCWTCQTCS